MERGLQWKWMFRENVGFYQNQVIRIDDTDFVLSTLWSRINPNDEKYFVWKGMNDFRQIKFDGKLLQVEEFNRMHETCMDFIGKVSKRVRLVILWWLLIILPTLEVVDPQHKNLQY